MESLAFGVAGVLIAAISLALWWRWGRPWRDVERIAEAAASGETPPGFLVSGNPSALRVGFALEKLANRRRELEARLSEGQLSVQAVFGAMLDGLVVVDERRRIRMVNREFGRLFGSDHAEPGTPLLEVIGHASMDRLVTEAMATGEPRRESIQMSRGPSAGRELEVSAVPLAEPSAANGGAVVLFRDVTQLRQAEEMRRDFVANVSHELRTPLSIFRGYLETLLDDPQQPPGELLRILEVMERHSDRLNALVEDVLTLARLESPEAELDLAEIRLPAFFETIIRDWETRLGARGLHAELHVSPEVTTLQADEGRLQEIIYNLLDNAVKYSQPGGVVTLRAEPARDEEMVRLSVSDQGKGIPAADVPRIFERFYRADKARSRAHGGTGLGLSIVKHIAQLHGGRVEAKSEVGRGTTISVLLPAAEDADEGTDPA
ncbi:MAG: PAS domain-containing protein [Chthoniobacterales bacterium]|nr:PAS domain-containing protein [Chthoniobacterales bacterium]